MVVIIEAEQLSIGYGNRLVGRDLNVSVGKGEVLALIGPNGGGKTTLLKTLLGLIPPLAGTIRLAGKELERLSIRERARLMAYVPQIHTGTFPFTVADLVLTGRSAYGDLLRRPSARDYAVVEKALQRLGISHLSDRPYTQISGGERQLALIARAMAQEPEIVFLDEPTASLDFGNQGNVLREIRALADHDQGVVFSTHDPNHALRFADRAFLIRDGTCLAMGVPKTVVTAELLSALYRTEVRVIAGENELAFLPG
jgi:iron complex transport system ATP-binding protein